MDISPAAGRSGDPRAEWAPGQVAGPLRVTLVLHQSPSFSPRPQDFSFPFCPLGRLCRAPWVVS